VPSTQQPLGYHGAEDLPPAGAAALAEEPDLQQLAAARGQHVVAHVRHEREAVGVARAVRHAGEPQDPVPAPAAQRERAAAQEQREGQPGEADPGPGQARRVLARDPPRDRGERD
jgi:hypothetical protein